MLPEIRDIQRQYDAVLARLAKRAPISHHPARHIGQPTHSGDAHVELLDGALHYVVTERGSELHRRAATDADELVYWLIDDVLSGVVHRMRLPLLDSLLRRDPRRFGFRRHLALLRALDPAWAERKRAYLEDVLARHPFRDGVRR